MGIINIVPLKITLNLFGWKPPKRQHHTIYAARWGCTFVACEWQKWYSNIQCSRMSVFGFFFHMLTHQFGVGYFFFSENENNLNNNVNFRPKFTIRMECFNDTPFLARRFICCDDSHAIRTLSHRESSNLLSYSVEWHNLNGTENDVNTIQMMWHQLNQCTWFIWRLYFRSIEFPIRINGQLNICGIASVGITLRVCVCVFLFEED